jgi:hypothetical protein
MKKELLRFTITHRSGIEYSRVSFSELWFLFFKKLQGWNIKITSIKAIDREEHSIIFIGEKNEH